MSQCQYVDSAGNRCTKECAARFNSTIKSKYCPHHTYVMLTSSVKSKNPAVKTKPRKKSPKSRAMENADLWFSRYIRIKYSFKIATDGTVIDKCIITGTIKPAKEMDNGHCFSRAYLTTRYEEDNCRPQNRSSNRFSGEADHYTFIDNLTAEIGKDRFGRLDKLRRENGEDSVEFYRAMSDKYRKKTNELLKKIGAKKWW